MEWMMDDKPYQIIGLFGFIIAGILFVIVGMRAGDVLTTIGSAVWTASCLVWLWPLLRR